MRTPLKSKAVGTFSDKLLKRVAPFDNACASMMRLDAPALIADAAPVPKPGRGEILVRIFAAGVTPTELLWYPTTHRRDGSKRSGAVPGHEFSGNHPFLRATNTSIGRG
jgi:hypothetical protein